MTEARDVSVPDVSGYRVERVLGSGGFGCVVAATSAEGAPVALKVATAGDAVAAAQLSREIRILEALAGTASPRILGSGALGDGTPWVALEMLPPPSLQHRLEELAGPMPFAEFSATAPALVDAVAAVHAAGFAHLDLKPANIFVGAAVRLIDFGLARPLQQRDSSAPSFAGTAEYASPEQCEERPGLDARSDLYSVGVILYQSLTGRVPFTGDAQSIRSAHVALRPPRPSTLAPVPEQVERVILRTLSKDRAHRYQSAPELKAALVAALEDHGRAERPAPAASAPGQRPVERRHAGILLFASSADVGSIQSTVRRLGGELGHAARGRYAAVFPGEAGQDPVRRAFRAGQVLAERGLAPRSLVDVASVNAQRRADGTVRYIAPELGREQRYAKDTDPTGQLATSAAAEVLADIRWEPLPGRPGIFIPRAGTTDPVQAATVVQLGAGPLVGRDEVLRALIDGARQALEGVPTVAAVIAEPGHGKTHLSAALVEAMHRQLPAAELIDVRAREPVSGDTGETLRTLLTRALDLAPGVAEDGARARFAAVAGRGAAAELWPAVALTLGMAPTDATRVRALSGAPGVLRSMAMRAAGEALRGRARRRPICLLIDDAQFADDTALDAIEYATLAEAGAPLFACAFARPAFAEARKSFGERAARHQLHRLDPLPPERAAELCRRLLLPAENVPAGAIERLVQRTQGVPLLMVELVRGLKRDGVVRKRMRGDTWFLATDELDKLPDSALVEWLAQRELSALEPELAAHARLAALLGAEFGVEEVEGVVNCIEDAATAAAFPLDAHVATRRLSSLGVLLTTRAGAFRFRHALVRDAVARAVPARERSEIHAAAARFYRTTHALPDVRRLPLLAQHAAEAGLRAEAATLYLQLAREAAERHAYLDAERSYTSALALLDGGDTQARLFALRGRGSMRYRIGRYDDSIADTDAARALAHAGGDRIAEAEIALDAATVLDWMTDFARSRALVEDAERLAGHPAPQQLQARLLLGQGRSLARAERYAEACEKLRQAAALAEKVGDGAYETLIISLVLLEHLLTEIGEIDEAASMAERALALARERGDQTHLVAALLNRRNVLIARKDPDAAVTDLVAVMQIAREIGMLVAEYYGHTNLAELLYQRDDLDRAAEHALRAMEIEERRPEVASRGPIGVLRLARIEAYRGNDGEARALLQRIDEAVARARSEGRASGALSPSEAVLRDMVDLATRDASAAEWEALLSRSARESIGQEPIEVADLYGVWALRHGKTGDARRAYAEAAARAARIPNIMDARLRKNEAATGLQPT